MENLLPEVEKHVISLFGKLPASFLYHNLNHTKNVVQKVTELIEGEQVPEEEAQALLIAAWFHDIGYIENPDNHENIGAKQAEVFLEDKKVLPARIELVKQLILATKMGYEPQTLAEKIIRDADCAHFGSKEFNDLSEALREEWRLMGKKTYSDVEWTEESINFFTNHHRYYTNHALGNWLEGKNKNLANLFKRLKKQRQEAIKEKKREQEFALKKNKATLPERGIETMFRVALRNHITLSDIADTKANILLSVNAIIVSLALSNLLPKLDNPSNHYLIYPSIVFVAFTVASMILSVLATRPNVTKGKFTKEDVANKKVNLIFFGNFHQMKLDDFEWAMGEMMQDRDYLYGSLTKDLYFLGLVLNRKYNLLRLTYTVFMIGIIISVLAFAISFYMQEGATL